MLLYLLQYCNTILSFVNTRLIVTTQTTFLGWHAPPVKLLCNWLLEHSGPDNILDLSAVTIVLPSASGVKHLQQAIIEETTSRNQAFLPPELITIGGLPEQLYPHKSAASESFQQLAWVRAIKEVANSNGLQTLLPILPAAQNQHAWQKIAESVAAVHRELSGEGLTFTDLVDYCKKENRPYEIRRWQELKLIQDAYLSLLDHHQVWDLQTARVIALRNEEISAEPSRQFVIAGCSDLSATLRGFLAAISAQTEFIVFSPPEFAQRFDDVGCLIPEMWDASIPALPISQIKLASDPNHQCELILDTITDFPEKVSAADILVATPDPKDQKQIVRQLHHHHIKASVPTGPPLSKTNPVLLVRTIKDYLGESNFAALSSLLRHPDVINYVLPNHDPTEVLRELTSYHEQHLPLDDTNIRSNSKRYPALASAVETMHRWTRHLHTTESCLEHHEALIKLLTIVYGDIALHRETDLAQIKAITSITHQSIELATAYDQLELGVSIVEFLSQLLDSFATLTVPSIPIPDGLSISGWLDAPWSTHSYVILTSVNEGIIPTTSNTELFIQDQTRIALGLLNNQRRLARDAYALALLRHSRQLTAISKRTTYQGDPLAISRLLLHGPIEQQARLVKQFSIGEVFTSNYRLKNPATNKSLSPLTVRLAPHQINSVSVTALASYLKCPLRYYLNHVLHLKSVDDYSQELSPQTFGNFVHKVLDQFGVSAHKDSIDEEEIFEFLRNTAISEFRRNYGQTSYPTVRLQLEQIFLRLSAFASWQAKWRADGWLIQEVEYRPHDPATILDQHPEYKIHGRIDRIDYHPGKATYAIFDYKTSESSTSPDTSHKSNEPPGWSDLQLPMYRHLAKEVTQDAPILLGYITLGKELADIGAKFATWDEELLADADQTAVQVIKAIHKGEFLESKDDIPVKYDHYAELLGRTTLDHPGIEITEVSS